MVVCDHTERALGFTIPLITPFQYIPRASVFLRGIVDVCLYKDISHFFPGLYCTGSLPMLKDLSERFNTFMYHY